MFAWLERFRRAHALPDEPPERVTGQVRVDFIGEVISPNTCTSPITNWEAALLEIVLVDWETIRGGASDLIGQHDEERFTTLGGARYGNGLVIGDSYGHELYIESATALRIVPLSTRPAVLDTPPPPELGDAARSSKHLLSYRETRFREGDRVRVIATVTSGRAAPEPGLLRGFVSGGYRDGRARVLVPVEGERLELREML